MSRLWSRFLCGVLKKSTQAFGEKRRFPALRTDRYVSLWYRYERIMSVFQWLPLVLFAVVAIVLFSTVGNRERRRAQVLQGGIPAWGTVLGVRQTGAASNSHPEVELQLNVVVPGQEPYELTMKGTIPRPTLPEVQPGSTLALKVDRNDPNRVELEESWGR